MPCSYMSAKPTKLTQNKGHDCFNILTHFLWLINKSIEWSLWWEWRKTSSVCLRARTNPVWDCTSGDAGGRGKVGIGLSSQDTRDRTRWNDLRLHQGRLRLDTSRKLFQWKSTSAAAQAAQGGGGVDIPGNAQETSGFGSLGRGAVGVFSWGLVLVVFSKLVIPCCVVADCGGAGSGTTSTQISPWELFLARKVCEPSKGTLWWHFVLL